MNFWRKLPKDKQQKILLVGIVTVAAVAVTMQFFVTRAFKNYATTKQEVARLQGAITDTESRAKKASHQEATLKQVQEFVQTQQAGMVSGDAFAWMVREVSLLAEHHPVKVISLRPAGIVTAATGKSLAMYGTRLEVAGEYDQLGEFIRDLENHFPTSQVRTLELNGNVAGNGTHQANLNLIVPVCPPPAVNSSGASPRKATAS